MVPTEIARMVDLRNPGNFPPCLAISKIYPDGHRLDRIARRKLEFKWPLVTGVRMILNRQKYLGQDVAGEFVGWLANPPRGRFR